MPTPILSPIEALTHLVKCHDGDADFMAANADAIANGGMEAFKGELWADARAAILQATSSADPNNEPLYYAKANKVFQRPVRNKKPDGTTEISMGFPICEMTEAAGNISHVVADLMNGGQASMQEAAKPILSALKAMVITYRDDCADVDQPSMVREAVAQIRTIEPQWSPAKVGA